MAQIPDTLRNFTAFVDGYGQAGLCDEITLPVIELETEEYRGGGMDAPVEIDVGQKALTATIKFKTYNDRQFRLWGLIDGAKVPFTFRGAMRSTRATTPIVVKLRGVYKKIDMGSLKTKETGGLTCEIAARFYQLTIGGVEQIYIDIENMVRRIGGVDQLAELRQALNI